MFVESESKDQLPSDNDGDIEMDPYETLLNSISVDTHSIHNYIFSCIWVSSWSFLLQMDR